MDTVFIEREELQQRRVSQKDMVLIDTLPNAVYLQRHIPGAINACVFEVSFLEQVHAFVADTSMEIVLYGSSERSYDAITAAVKLQRAGYARTSVLRGGMEGWLAAGMEIVGSGGEETGERETLLTLNDGVYELDCSKSVVEWAGRNQNSRHFGILQFSSGDLAVRGKSLQGEWVVDMESLENINLAGDELQPVLVSHLKSDDFFFTRFFPKTTLIVTEGTVAERPYLTIKNCMIRGELVLRGEKKEIAFEATLSSLSGGMLSLEAHFDLDRTKWGIIYGSTRFFEHLGMHTVFDDISLQLRVIFNLMKS